MIFSRKSSFELANKRALFVAADKAILYQGGGRGIDRAYVFSADEEGLRNYTRYLDETDKSPLFVLVDVVEEEYRQDVIPHVYGADRRSVLERKHARLFRGTKYCHSIIQGREPEGRKDDRVLLTAITRPEVVSPWVRIANEAKAPVAGIYSLPILSQHLLKRIGAKGPNVLLISMQSASGLRQSFFRDQQLKISRLAQMPRIGSVPYASHLLGELEKLRRYLNSLALISRDAPLQVYILSHGDLLAELEQHCSDSEEERFFLIDVAELNKRLGIAERFNSNFSEAAFSQLLLDLAPKNHYAVDEETKYFSLYRMRTALYAASVLLLLGGIGWSGFNFLEAVSLKQQALDAAEKASFYQTRYETARQNLPPTPVEPRDIKTAVDVVEKLNQYKSSPVAIMKTLGSVLTLHPRAEVDRIEWFSNVDPNAKAHGSNRSVDREDEQRFDRSLHYSHYDIAVVDGHLASFDGDYRQAINSVDALAEDLRQQNNVHAIVVLQYPLDVESDANLAGMATENLTVPVARFSVKVILGVPDGSEQT